MVYLPLWKIWKSVRMIIPNWMENHQPDVVFLRSLNSNQRNHPKKTLSLYVKPFRASVILGAANSRSFQVRSSYHSHRHHWHHWHHEYMPISLRIETSIFCVTITFVILTVLIILINYKYYNVVNPIITLSLGMACTTCTTHKMMDLGDGLFPTALPSPGTPHVFQTCSAR